MQEEFDVLGMVQDFNVRGSLLCTTTVLGLAWVDALEDAQATEVVEGELQAFQGLFAGYVVGRLAFVVLRVELLED